MNPFTLLKEDHKKVKDLFKKYEELGDRAFVQKEELCGKICSELELHTQVEEDIFYPAIKAAADEKGQELIAEAFEEHAVVKKLIEELGATDPAHEEYDAKMKVMRENVEHHIKEEEGELFPKAKEALGDTASVIGEEMEIRKRELKTHPRADKSHGKLSTQHPGV